MNPIKNFMLLLLFFVFCLQLTAQTKGLKVSWSKSGSSIWIDQKGKVEIIKEIEVAVATPFSDLNGFVAGPPPVWTGKYNYIGVDSTELQINVQDMGGGPWIVWVRAINQMQVASIWAKSAQFTFAPLPPKSISVSYSTIVVAPPPPADAVPVVAFSNLSAGQQLAGTVTLIAAATDDKGVAGVQMFVDGLQRSNTEVSAPYAFLWNTSEVADGDRVFVLRATDSTGQAGSSAPLIARVKNAVIILPPPPEEEENYAQLAWEPPTTNADGTPLTDLGGYRIYHTTAPGACHAPEGQIDVNTLAYAFTGLAPGTHYFTLTAFDLSGNESVCVAEQSKEVQ